MTGLAQLGLFYLLIYFLINGLDDLGIDLRALRNTLRRRRIPPYPLPSPEQLRQIPEQGIAILVPLWQESTVIEAMVETNLRQVVYANYRFFLGVYPNDEATSAVAAKLAARHPRVHLVQCSRPGPTSKADCLNHLYAGLQRFHEIHGACHTVVMFHDAEDVLHPLSLKLANWYTATYGMVQIPVLPVHTRKPDWVQAIYCDEFAEFLSRDLPVRAAEGAFLPSNGVGTAVRIGQLESLRALEGGQLFDPECLTEDYELGLKLHLAGCRQLLLPLTREYGSLLATRECFPQTIQGAILQRTRWVIGQCLQSWEKNGWPFQKKLLYWFWRDRRGLLGNYLNVLALALLAVSAVALVWPAISGLSPWLWLASSVPGAVWLYGACSFLALERLLVRTVIVSRVYGWTFAMGVFPRMMLSCGINLVATTEALRIFAIARWRRKRLRWLKTDHTFPDEAPGETEAVSRPAALAATAGEPLILPGPASGASPSSSFTQQRIAGRGGSEGEPPRSPDPFI